MAGSWSHAPIACPACGSTELVLVPAPPGAQGAQPDPHVQCCECGLTWRQDPLHVSLLAIDDDDDADDEELDVHVNIIIPLRVIANSAASVWATGRGLAAAAAELSSYFPDDPIPTPGLDQFVDQLNEACTTVSAVADGVGDLEDPTADDPVVATAIDRAHASLAPGTRALRRLAQLALGVTTYLPDDPAVTLVERAAIGVLKLEPTSAAELADDGVDIVSSDVPGFRVELAGALCRMIVDHHCRLTIDSPGTERPGSIAATVDAIGNLELTLTAPAGVALAELEALGWTTGPSGLSAKWKDPLIVSQPAELIVSTLTHLGVEDPEGLRLTVRRVS